jgi:hypothetical protein
MIDTETIERALKDSHRIIEHHIKPEDCVNIKADITNALILLRRIPSEPSNWDAGAIAMQEKCAMVFDDPIAKRIADIIRAIHIPARPK